MHDEPSAAEQIGEMAARALDTLDGGQLIGAVLMLAAFNPDDDTEFKSLWFAPDGQTWPMSLGIVEDWRMEQQMQAAVSCLELRPPDEEGGDNATQDDEG